MADNAAPSTDALARLLHRHDPIGIAFRWFDAEAAGPVSRYGAIADEVWSQLRAR